MKVWTRASLRHCDSSQHWRRKWSLRKRSDQFVHAPFRRRHSFSCCVAPSMERVLVGGRTSLSPMLSGVSLSSAGIQPRSRLPATSRGRASAVGVANLGNTCFLSAVLEGLASVHAFRNHLGGLVKRFPSLKTRSDGSLTRLLDDSLTKLNQPSDSPFDPKLLLHPLRRKFSSMRQQQDAQELFHHIMDIVEEETLEASREMDCGQQLWDVRGSGPVLGLPRVGGRNQGAGPGENADFSSSVVEDEIGSLCSSSALRLQPAVMRALFFPKEEPGGDSGGDGSLQALAGPGAHPSPDSSPTRTLCSGLSTSRSFSEMYSQMQGPCLLQRVSPTNDLNPFYGSLASRLNCTSCKAEKLKFEKFLDIPLAIPTSCGPRGCGVTLEDCLRAFVAKEEVESPCSKCTSETRLKGYSIGRSPPALCLNLHRLRYENQFHSSKIHDFVHFPLQLDLGPFQSHISSETAMKYDLKAVVEHHGGADGRSGHFTTFRRAKLADGLGALGLHKWVFINDEYCQEVAEEDVLSARAYMLFYERSW